MLGVTVSSSTAAIGSDEQSDADLEATCLATLGRASSNGPPDAYNACALDATLTGETSVTRATTSEDDVGGAVTIWIASSTGPVAGGVVTAVQSAVDLWATPVGFTPTVASASADAQTITFDVSGTDIPASAETDITALVTTYLGTVPIGGYVSASALVALAHGYLVDAGATDVDVTLTSATGGDLADGDVATVASVTVTEV
jgi:hypothetical protein